ncbi:MAG: NAD(P)H-hydrate epimerase [Planctomycetota bacterium]
MSADEEGKQGEGPLRPRELVAVENLARTEALAILGWVRDAPERDRRAAVFAGRSSSGAAALAVARHFSNYDVGCRTLLCGPAHRLAPVTLLGSDILDAMGASVAAPGPVAVSKMIRELGPSDVLVDGAGDDPDLGREKDFAEAVRGPNEAARVVRLAPSPGYRAPVPTPEDVLFSPGSAARSREDVRLFDSTAIEGYRIPGLVLMENAGWRAAREAYAMLGFEAGSKVLVLAGAGNNGGDGFVVARHLAGWGAEVGVVLAASRDKVFDDARTNLEFAEADGVEVAEAALPDLIEAVLPAKLGGVALVVDALLGTGLSGKVRGGAARAIELLNEHGARVLAVDTPSGLDANTGEVLGVATRAERTVTFAFPKLGFARGEGPERTGEVIVADISMPRTLWQKPPTPAADAG